jgi:hypothetical protein
MEKAMSFLSFARFIISMGEKDQSEAVECM